MSSALCAY